ncbi:hypothetical protein K5D44_17705 [Pseudomonas cichorii]|uniref:hypothetical protein n=1 Tax=Pseudomonas cichorii TaxID=36746 RepID=UPI001910CDCA|nr:hypothetical protein [Pseudomonas cichorii]MBX8558239.1 hypothetical protein [Pseudomonas cichorii]MBX8566535.1 hypothetical protein [Pseudomonas cichorii]MBX8597960.1 hypothetical protein [Pseudomonas cichorii]
MLIKDAVFVIIEISNSFKPVCGGFTIPQYSIDTKQFRTIIYGAIFILVEYQQCIIRTDPTRSKLMPIPIVVKYDPFISRNSLDTITIKIQYQRVNI